jgi:hypothetical protein
MKMPVSIFSASHLLSALLFSSTLLHADVITLGSDGKISGKVESISEDGVITLSSPLSPEKLQFSQQEFDRIKFEEKEPSKITSNNILYLKNGDVMPVSVDELDDKQLTFQLPWSEKLNAARSAIDSLHFGTSENVVLYRGPLVNEWDLGRAWKFNNSLESQAWGSTHRKFESFPDRYILNFSLEWTGNAGIKCLFASNSTDGNGVADCYFIQFNSAGLELKRQASGSKKFTSLATFNDLTPDDMEDNQMEVEIRVDRINRILQLAVNGKQLRNNIIDPIETGPVPNGNIISFISTSSSEDKHTITDIRVSTWGSASAEARLEKRSDGKSDVLYDIESNRSSGSLKSIKPGKELQVLFENPHDPAPKPLPGSKIAVIYFSGEKSEGKAPPFRIQLHGLGTLLVDSFTLRDGKIFAKHPVLGELEIATSQISEISRKP